MGRPAISPSIQGLSKLVSPLPKSGTHIAAAWAWNEARYDDEKTFARRRALGRDRRPGRSPVSSSLCRREGISLMETFKNAVMSLLAAMTLLFVGAIALTPEEKGPLPMPAAQYNAWIKCVDDTSRTLIYFGMRDPFEVARQAKKLCN
jgi:hypothetical protein